LGSAQQPPDSDPKFGNATSSSSLAAGAAISAPAGAYDTFSGYSSEKLFPDKAQVDPEDLEAEKIYASVDSKVNAHHIVVSSSGRGTKRARGANTDATDSNTDSSTNGATDCGDTNSCSSGSGSGSGGGSISSKFKDVKMGLKNVSIEEWCALPDVCNTTKRKQEKREEIFMPMPDYLIDGGASASAALAAAAAATVAIAISASSSSPTAWT
jgi:hypothetical protein